MSVAGDMESNVRFWDTMPDGCEWLISGTWVTVLEKDLEMFIPDYKKRKAWYDKILQIGKEETDEEAAI